MYFSTIVSPPFIEAIFSHAFAHILILTNTFFIYWIIERNINKPLIAFLMSALYLVSPFHLGAFFSNSQLQALFAETLLLGAIIFYSFEKKWISILLLFCANLMNTQLLVFAPIIFRSTKITHFQKILIAIQILITLLFLIPNYFHNMDFYLTNYKTIFYSLSLFSIPFTLPFLNNAVVIPGFLDVQSMILICFSLMIIFYLFRKNYQIKFVLILIPLLLISTLIPFKSLDKESEFLYNFSPGYYPVILYIVIFLIYKLCDYYKFSKASLIGCTVLGLLWLGSNILNQLNMRDELKIWEGAFVELPLHYRFEEELKLRYARILLKNKEFAKAEILILNSARKFNAEIWYTMLLNIKLQNRDESALEQIKKEMIQRKVPVDGYSN